MLLLINQPEVGASGGASGGQGGSCCWGGGGGEGEGFDEERDMRKKVGSDEDVEEKWEARKSSRGKGGSVR